MRPLSNQLTNVVVANCTDLKKIKANYYRGRPSSYIGPGPETRIIIISHYNNNKHVTGFIQSLDFYTDIDNRIPMRLHWYAWDKTLQKPGEELTQANLIFYPNHKGWNKFALPERSIYYDEDGVVLGIEFIYTAESKTAYAAIINEDDKLAWLNNNSHRWSLGMQDKASEPSYYIANNENMKPYNKDNDKGYNQPALRIIVSECKNQ